MSELYYLHKYLRKYKYHFLLSIFFLIGANVFSIVPARLIKQSFDSLKAILDDYHRLEGREFIIYKGILKQITVYNGLILLMGFLKAICSFLTRQPILSVANKVESESKNEIYNHYQSLAVSFYMENNTADMMSRITEDVNRFKSCLGPPILFGFNALMLFLILTSYMLYTNVKLTLYALLPLTIFITFYIKDRIYYRFEKLQEKIASLTIFTQETFLGVRIIQAFSRERTFINNFLKARINYKRYALELTSINAIFTPLAISVNSLGTILGVIVGGREVIKGNLTIANIAEFFMCMHLITWPIITISLIINFIQRAAASQKRINKFLQEKDAIISTKNLKEHFKGKIVLQDVSFIYPNTGIKALNNISFEIAAGESVAIIGPTGSGKNTLANLLVRLYGVDSGLITIDNIPIQDYDVAFLREQIGYVPQDVFLFANTIENNIAVGKNKIQITEFERVIKDTDLYATLQQFPDEIQTKIGERGVTLSGCQKRRISIAGALIRNPNLLILDDSLSAVDIKTEKNILQRLKHIMQNRTTILLSHKVYANSLVDKIFLLDLGAIVEYGSHEELLAAKGLYYNLYMQQNT